MNENELFEGVRNGARSELRLSILADAIFNAARLNYSGKKLAFVPFFGFCSQMTTTACSQICKRSRQALQRTVTHFDPRRNSESRRALRLHRPKSAVR